MKVLIIGALCIALAVSTPLPQKIEQQPGITPIDDLRLRTQDRDSRQFPSLLSSFSLRDVVNDPFSVIPGIQLSQRPDAIISSAFGSPDFLNVPVAGAYGTGVSTGLESGVGHGAFGNPFDFVEKVLGDTRKLQEGLLGAPFTQQQPDQTNDGSGLISLRKGPEERPPRPTSVLDLVGGLPAIKSVGSFDKLPDNYDKSTVREEEIDGVKVQVRETIKKQSSPFGQAVAYSKVIGN